MSTLIIPEKSISKIKGRAIPKPANDQNTDDIVPARYLKEITFEKMGEYAYADERFKDGKPVEDHPLNDPKYRGGSILVAGANYGCGSSREHAPQALRRYGIRAIIAESFAEIFAGNCASLGVVGVAVPTKNIAEIVESIRKNPSAEIEIDLGKKVIRYGDRTIGFEMPEGRRQALLNGTWDAMAILEQNREEIASVEKELPYLSFK